MPQAAATQNPKERLKIIIDSSTPLVIIETLEEARANLEEAVSMVLDANREMCEQSLAGADVIRESLILPAA